MPTRNPRALPVLALLAAAAILPACSSSGAPAPRGARLAEPQQIDYQAWSAMGYRWDWNASPSLSVGGSVQFVEAFEDVIVVQDSRAMVSAIEAATGRVRWSKQVAETNTRFFGLTRRDDSVIVTNETELFEIELRTGNTLDRTQIHGIATTRPVFFGPLAVMGTAKGRLVAIDVRHDLRVWEYQFDGLIESDPIRLDDERLAGISTRGEIRVLEAATARGLADMRISGDSAESMVSDGFALIVGSLDQSLYGFDTDDGHRLWRLRSSAPVTVQPVLIGGTVYATTADHGLLAMDSLSGEILWNNDRLGGWVVTTNDGDLMVWTGHELLRVDAERGDLINRLPLPGMAGLRADSPEDGNIYAIAAGGSIARFSPR